MGATRYDPDTEFEDWISHLGAREPLPPGMDARMRAALRSAAPRTTRAGGRAGTAGCDGGENRRPGSTISAVPAPMVLAGAGPAVRTARAVLALLAFVAVCVLLFVIA